MTSWSKALRVVERGLLWLGLLLLMIFSYAYIDRFLMTRAEMTRFEARQLQTARERFEQEDTVRGMSPVDGRSQIRSAGSSPWSAHGTELSHERVAEVSEALAVLRIPKLRLEVPVLEGTDELTLNRGVGRIAGTAHPGEIGNVGIAGHRDGFFRPLKDISAGDTIQLVTTLGTDVYAVDRIRISNPPDVSVLRPTTRPSLTLVTCYPFYFVGPAPQRFIVEASLKQ